MKHARSPRVILRSMVAALVLLACASPGRAQDAVITEQHGQWEMSYGAVYYRVFGYVQNKSPHPIHYVKLRLDLLDAGGKSVYSVTGYNQKAESLGAVEGLGADTLKPVPFEEKLAKIDQIQPGEKDLFRIGVSKDDIPKKPKFKSYSLKVLEAK
jgi:hypothetical protein